MPKKIQVKISGQNGWKPAIIAVVTDGEWSFDSQPEVEDIKMVDESECEHDGEIKSYICQKCGEDVRDSNKIEKLETSKFDSTYDNILIDKINELIEAKDKESRKFDKLSQLVTSEQTVILLVNVFGAEAVKDFLLEEAEKKGEENDTR